MQTTLNMGLTIWDGENDPYNHAQLAANLYAIDKHDHSQGKGIKISTDGIAAGAITTNLLANGAVTTSVLADASVTSAKLASSEIPLGTVIPWWRPTPQVDVPLGWVIPTGQSLTSDKHDYGSIINPSNPTSVTITIPDLRNRFILGADHTNTGPDPSTPPAIGQIGGSNTINIAHSHNITGRGVKGTIESGNFDDQLDYSVVLRNWDYPFWPWANFWWGYSAQIVTDTQLSRAQDIRPSYVGLLLLMKVKKS